MTLTMDEPIVIEVTGNSRIYHRPERGIVNIRVTSSSPNKEVVSQEVTSTSNRLIQIFSNLAPKDANGMPTEHAAITAFSVGTMRSWSHVREPRIWPTGQPYLSQRQDYAVINSNNDPKESQPIHDAETTMEAIFQDFDKMGEIIGELTMMPHVFITSIDWRLTDPTKASLASETRKLAIADAIKVAEDYMDGFGCRIVPVKVVGQESWPTHASRVRQAAGVWNEGSVSGYERVTVLKLEPVNVECADSVSVTFHGVPKK